MYDKNQLKELLKYVSLFHEYPSWFNSCENEEIVSELEQNGVLYMGIIKTSPVVADPYSKRTTVEREALCVNKIKLKAIYGIEL